MHEHDHDLPRLRARLARLEDHEAIRDLFAQYVMGADRCIAAPSPELAAAQADLFVDDARAAYGPLGDYEGRAQLIHAFGAALPGTAKWSRHHTMNPRIDVQGDAATATALFIVVAWMRGTPSPSTVYGVYEARLVRTAAGWRFAALRANFSDPPAP